MNTKITNRFFSANSILVLLSVACTILFFFPQFWFLWSNGSTSDKTIRSSVAGIDYLTGVTARKGWGPNSEHSIDGAHPFTIICLLIPLIITLLLLMKKTSNFILKGMAIMTFVDFVAWQIMRSRVKGIARKNHLDYESSACFNFYMLLLICMFIMIIVTLVKRWDSGIDLSKSLSAVKINPKRRTVIGYCGKCGSPIKNGDIFCSSCGKKLTESAL